MKLWLDQFELRCELLEVPAGQRALWCHSVVGARVQEALAGLTPDVTYEQKWQMLLATYGVTDEVREARYALHQLTQGSLTLKQLAVWAQYLTNVALGA